MSLCFCLWYPTAIEQVTIFQVLLICSFQLGFRETNYIPLETSFKFFLEVMQVFVVDGSDIISAYIQRAELFVFSFTFLLCSFSSVCLTPRGPRLPRGTSVHSCVSSPRLLESTPVHMATVRGQQRLRGCTE